MSPCVRANPSTLQHVAPPALEQAHGPGWSVDMPLVDDGTWVTREGNQVRISHLYIYIYILYYIYYIYCIYYIFMNRAFSIQRCQGHHLRESPTSGRSWSRVAETDGSLSSLASSSHSRSSLHASRNSRGLVQTAPVGVKSPKPHYTILHYTLYTLYARRPPRPKPSNGPKAYNFCSASSV